MTPIAWREARALLAQLRGPLLIGCAFVLVNRVAALGLPASVRYLLDDVIARERLGMLLPIAGLAAGTVLLEAATSYALQQVVGIASHRAIARLREELQAHVLRLPVGTFDGTPTGLLVSRVMTDTEQLRVLLGTGLLQLLGGLLTGVIAFGVLFTLHAGLAAIVAALMLLYLAGLLHVLRRLQLAGHELGDVQGTVTARLAELLVGIRVIKAHAAEQRETAQFAQSSQRLCRIGVHAHTGSSTLIAVMTLATGAIGALLLVEGTRAVLDGTMSLGDLALFVSLTSLLSAPLLQCASIGGEATRALAALSRIGELRVLLTKDEAAPGAPPRRAVSAVSGAVTFERVSFAYGASAPMSGGHSRSRRWVACASPTAWALRDVSFHAPAGSTTAFVGPSGGGKSTICLLLLAFDDPTDGRILIDGVPLSTLDRPSYRRQLGVVLHDTMLFDGSIADNIRYHTPDASLRAVRQASHAAHCDEFIARLARGYDTAVGERGVRLSGGQRQRIAIARALLADPRILILDEATSALDSESELLVQDALRVLMRGRTTFVIAHRLATIRHAHQVLVLDGGTIGERGTHGELLAMDGQYARASATQRGVRAGTATDGTTWTRGRTSMKADAVSIAHARPRPRHSSKSADVGD